MPIQPLNEALHKTLITLNKYQNGEIKQIKTKRDWLDKQGGVTPKTFITIFGASFGGKSTELESLKNDIMDENVNSEANEYVWVSNAMEMTNFATTLRDIKRLTKKEFKEILNSKFTEEEKVILKSYRDKKTDGRFFLNQIPLSAEEFVRETREFLEANKDKKAVFFDLDHAGLLKAKNDNKKLAIDDMVDGLNMLKNLYDNFIVVLLMQANRGVLSRLKPNSNESRLRRDDLSQSDSVFQVSDFVYGVQNASYLGIDEYAKIKPERYPHLSHRFTEPDKNGKVSLYSENCIFIEVLKDRTANIGDADLFTIEIGEFEKEAKTTNTKTISLPTFENFNSTAPLPTVKPFEAFGQSFEKKDDAPF